MTAEELKKFCDGEFGNIERITAELYTVYKQEKTEYSLSEQAAVAAFLVNVYSGVENILKQMLVFDRLDISDSPSWHEKVLKKAIEIGILTPDLFQVFSKYLAFRNFFIYAYIFNMNWDETKILVEALNDVLKNFKTEIEEYIQTI